MLEKIKTAHGAVRANVSPVNEISQSWEFSKACQKPMFASDGDAQRGVSSTYLIVPKEGKKGAPSVDVYLTPTRSLLDADIADSLDRLAEFLYGYRAIYA